MKELQNAMKASINTSASSMNIIDITVGVVSTLFSLGYCPEIEVVYHFLANEQQYTCIRLLSSVLSSRRSRQSSHLQDLL